LTVKMETVCSSEASDSLQSITVEKTMLLILIQYKSVQFNILRTHVISFILKPTVSISVTMSVMHTSCVKSLAVLLDSKLYCHHYIDLIDSHALKLLGTLCYLLPITFFFLQLISFICCVN
jgi:hypothetical protein